MKIQTQKIKIDNVLLLCGVIILTWLALIFMSATLFFFIGQSLSVLSLGMATVATFLIWGFFIRRNHSFSSLESLLGLFLFLISVAGSVGISGLIFDNSWDGQDYQQHSIVLIANGFNPVRDFALPEENYINRDLNHYPKAPWIISAALYQATGNIETGKALNSLLLLAGFFILYALLKSSLRINAWLSLLFAGIIIANPVSITQNFTFYIDGLIGIVLTIFIGSVAIYLLRDKVLGAFLIVLTLIIGVNIKFTGTAYLLIFALFSVIIQWIKESKKLHIPSLAWPCLIGFLLGIGLFGYSPYVRNTVMDHNPFYPVYGGTSDININFTMQGQYPAGFEKMGMAERLMRSLFSRSGNAYGSKGSQLKIPFTVAPSEVIAFRTSDVRVGGFGPLFGGILLLTLVIFLWGVLSKRSAQDGIILLALGGVLLSIFVNSENWWARYVPQIWLIPCLGILLALLKKRKVLSIFCILLSCCMFINIILITGTNFYSDVQMSHHINTVLSQLAESNVTYKFDLGMLESWKLKLDRYHVHYVTVSSYSELGCPRTLQSITYSPEICP